MTALIRPLIRCLVGYPPFLGRHSILSSRADGLLWTADEASYDRCLITALHPFSHLVDRFFDPLTFLEPNALFAAALSFLAFNLRHARNRSPLLYSLTLTFALSAALPIYEFVCRY